MTQLTRDDVLRLAQLARLAITDEEADAYQKDLTAILGYVEQLNTVDVSNLEPTSQVSGLVNSMRDDTVVDYGVSNEDLLRLAPATEGGQLKVKRMIA